MEYFGYGRVSTRQQTSKKYYQRQIDVIQNHFNFTDLEFDFDESSDGEGFEPRNALGGQLNLAAAFGVPLYIEQPDRLIKSYDDEQIESFYETLKRSGATIVYAFPNSSFHRYIKKLLTSNEEPPVTRETLVQFSDQYLRYRRHLINIKKDPDKFPPRIPYSTL